MQAKTEARESLWDALLDRILDRLQTSRSELRRERKSAARKGAIAVHLKQTTGAKNPWITGQLGMGDPNGVSRYVGMFRRGGRPDVQSFFQRITDVRT